MAKAISVIVPTYQRPDLLNRCLKALTLQDFDRNAYEIIVANDRPSFEIEKIVHTCAKRTQGFPKIRYVPVTGSRGPAAARNRGWHIAVGKVIAFTDDDTLPLPNWLSEGWAAMKNNVVAAWGYVRVPLPENPTDYELDASKLDGAEFVTANCFVGKAALLAVGGFDERFKLAWREDADLFFSLKQMGNVVYAPSAVVLHPIRPAPWGVSIRQQSKVLFDALLFKKHPQLYRHKIRSAPPWNYYAIVVSFAVMLLGLVMKTQTIATLGLACWIILTLDFCLMRLKKTSHSWRHIMEMAVTSILIPPLSVFWRVAGALKFRVFFI